MNHFPALSIDTDPNLLAKLLLSKLLFLFIFLSVPISPSPELSAPAIIFARYLLNSLCNGRRLSYSFLASGNKFIWKRTIAHSLGNSMNHCPCYTWRQCQSPAPVNPTRYTLDNEDFIPLQLQTTPSPMHSDGMRALLYSSAPALLLQAFLPPEALDYFPQSMGTSFWLFFSGSLLFPHFPLPLSHHL